jgi:hypothetical protein
MSGVVAHRLRAFPLQTRRFVAVALLPFAALLLWVAVVLPVTALYESQVQWRTEATDTIAQAQGATVLLANATEQLRSLPAAPLWTKLYSVSKPGSAASMVQTDVNGILAASHAVIQSITPLASTPSGDLSKVGLRVAASMTIDELKVFLNSVTTHPRSLRVEKLSVLAPSVQMAAQNPMLTVTVEVFGLEWVQTSQQPATENLLTDLNAGGN